MTRDDEPQPETPAATASSPRTIRFDDLAGDDDAGPAPHAEPPPWRRSPTAAPPADPVQPRSLVDGPTVPLRIPPVPSTSAATTPSTPTPPAPASSAPASLPADPSRRTLVFDDLSSAPAPAPAPEPAAPLAATASARSTARAADPSTPAPPPLRARPRPGDARRTAVSAVPAPAADEAPTREPVPVGRGLAGAALAVSGVALGIVVLLWITDDPDRDTVADGLGAAVSQPAVEPDAPVEPSPPARAAPPAVPAPAAPPPPAPSPPPPPATAPATPVVPVTVLNNSRRSGLAARAAAAFEQGGWPVAATGNFRGRIPVTTVYYDPGLEASARALADSFDGIARVRPRFQTLPARGVVVVVTREFAT